MKPVKARLPLSATALLEPQPFGVLDLGTGYAKALVIHAGPTGSLHVVGASQVPYPGRPREGALTASAAQLDAAAEARERAVERSPALAGRRVSPQVWVVAVPNHLSRTKSFVQESYRPVPTSAVDSAEAGALFSTATAACLESAAQTASAPAGNSPTIWLGPVWSALFLDEREVTSLEGFRATTFRAHLSHAFASAETVAGLRHWLDGLGVNAVFLPEASWAGEVLRRRRSCMLLDSGTYRTDLYLRDQQGGLLRLDLLSGGHYFSRCLSLAGGLAPVRAERLKLSYAGGRLRPRGRAKVEAVMQRAMSEWSGRVASTIRSAGVEVPGTWLTGGGASSLPEFSLLPGTLADASMAGFRRFPVLQPLAAADLSESVVPGPERLRPIHSVCLSLANRWAGMTRHRTGLADIRHQASLAIKAGFEVSGDWLKS